jgi:2,4-dienoyl-CoA reductase-like NADH-dependent reductase (Old Yellow Enzyme family)
MSLVFSPRKIGRLEIKNRFVHSATHESMAEETGRVTDDLIKRYRKLARGDIGLITPGYLFIHPRGRASRFQTGIHRDEMIAGLKQLVEAVHQNDAKIMFQLAHGGRQVPRKLIGQAPLAPSSKGRDPVSLSKAKKMQDHEIEAIIQAFAEAAGRAAQAGADAVQLHCAHGYLINEFLSPFFNDRQDQWGGSDEGRFRFLKEIIVAVKKNLPDNMPLLVKLNTNDFTPKKGITPELAKKYVEWLVDLKIDGVELSCGTYYTLHTVRGQTPINELAHGLPGWMRPVAKFQFKKLAPLCEFEEAYNLKAAKIIKPVMGEIPLLLVGGLRRLAHIEALIEKNYTDFISMSRPFIREPGLVKRFKEGNTEEASCISCNKCFAAIFNHIPLNCYVNGIPSKYFASR